MTDYVVKQPFRAGKPPSDEREYRVGDELTQGDVEMWDAGQLAKALQLGHVVKVAPEPAPVTEPEPQPAPAPAATQT